MIECTAINSGEKSTLLHTAFFVCLHVMPGQCPPMRSYRSSYFVIVAAALATSLHIAASDFHLLRNSRTVSIVTSLGAPRISSDLARSSAMTLDYPKEMPHIAVQFHGSSKVTEKQSRSIVET
jgi:hypothetical protein